MRLISILVGFCLLACNASPEPQNQAIIPGKNWLDQELLSLQKDTSSWTLQLVYQGKKDLRKPRPQDWKSLLEELGGREVNKALQQAALDSSLHHVQITGNCSEHSILCKDNTCRLKQLSWQECAGKLLEIEVEFLKQTAIFSSGKTIRYESGKSYHQTYWECLPGGDTLVCRIEGLRLKHERGLAD
ncbi:hypothetical protein MASR2M44_07100 [Bacteroidota bacterium]